MTENDLIELQTTLAHHEEQITDLNAVVTDQWAQIDALNARLTKALAKIEQIEHRPDGGDQDGLSSIERMAQERPPHW